MRVAIVGGGIVGLYLAWKLSAKGQQVVVFERKKEIGKMACSGLFSERILEFIPPSKKLIQNQIDSVLINFPRKTLNVKFSKKFLVMSHFQLDRLMADLARRAGTEIILNYNLKSLDELFLKKFERIIGCDGWDSWIRKKLELSAPSCRLGILGYLSQTDFSNYVETWPLSPDGFLWKIPRGKEIEYGILASSGPVLECFEKFLKANNLRPERKISGIIASGLALPSNGLITLCGEAAGLTKPWSGGGVIWGLMAGEILLKNFPDFLTYQREIKKFFLPRIIFSKIVTKIVYFLGFKIPWLLPKNLKIESDFLL